MRIGRTLAPAASPIPLLDVLKSLAHISDEGQTARFNSELRDYFGIKYCFLVSSGKAALYLILKALKEMYPEKNEVLIPAFTCYSVPSAIKKAGLRIRLCDVNPDTLDFDFDKLAEFFSQNITDFQAQHFSKLLCVLPTHLFGVPADIAKLRNITRGTVTIVEDAAQSMGAEYEGKKLGVLGDVGFFSLGRGKAFTTIEGGIILTNRDDIGQQLNRTSASLPGYGISEIYRLVAQSILLTLFLRPSLFWLPNSIPCLKLGETIFEQDFPVKKLSPFQAALAKNWQNKLNALQRMRRINVRYYLKMLPARSHHINFTQNHTFSDVIRLPLKTESLELRNQIISLSKKKGLGIMPSYPDSIDGIDELQKELKGEYYPGAKLLSERLMTLPVHPYVTQIDTKKICNLLYSTD